MNLIITWVVTVVEFGDARRMFSTLLKKMTLREGSVIALRSIFDISSP